MSRTIVIDGFRLRELKLVRDAKGQWQTLAVYDLTAGTTIVREVRRFLPLVASSQVGTALNSLLNSAQTQIQADELS